MIEPDTSIVDWGSTGTQRRHRGLDTMLLALGLDAHVDLDPPLGRHDVVGGADRCDRGRDGRADLGSCESGDRQHLMGDLDECVDALLRLESGMCGSAVHGNLEGAATLSARLQRAAVGRRFEDEYRTARQCPRFDQVA